MKKLLAMALALMLLTVCAAGAETAHVLTFYDAAARVSGQGQQIDANLEGLTAEVALGMPGEVPTIQLDVDNGDECLLKGTMQVIGEKLVVALDGMSRPVAVDMSQAGGMGSQGAAMAFGSLDQMSGVKLPKFNGVTIPKVDLMPLAGMLGATPEVDANGHQVANIEIPYEMVKSLLSSISQYRDMMPEAAQPYTSLLFNTIDMLTAGDNGIALKAVITDDGEASSLVLDVYSVTGGVTADAPLGGLQMVFAENQISIAVVLYQGEDAMNLGTLDVTSTPEAAELSFALDVMGMISFTGSMYPDEGDQVVAFALKAGELEANASLVYGEQEEGDFVTFTIDAPNMLNVQTSVVSALDETGAENGHVSFSSSVAGENPMEMAFESAFTEGIADVTFDAIENAGEAVSLESLSEEERAEVEAEMNAALSKLMNYINGAMAQPAA